MLLHTVDSAFLELVRGIGGRLQSSGYPNQFSQIDRAQPFNKVELDSSAMTATDFAVRYLEQKLLSKWKGWKKPGVDPKAEAIIRWKADEFSNYRTNVRLRALKDNTGYPGGDLVTIISMAQGYIQEVLGTFRYSKVLKHCRWGPGATWDYPNGTSRGQKISDRMSTTIEAQELMKLLIESDPNWIEAITGFYPSGPVSLVKNFFKITGASRFTTVPKDWDVDRGIDMQPTANGYLQQGVGQYLRRRLCDFGIDLDSQEENQLGAFYAFYSELATLDLKAASDSVTTELVSLLLPIEWSEYLFRLRTKYTQFGRDGAMVKTEKFSAMGNAFTFELETLIFWALAKACALFEGVKDDNILVYGDDIVCNRKIYDRLVYVLNYCGFRVNETKSFRSGAFFESCGKHYHSGVDVTPVYQKSVVNSPEECIRFHNRLVRWSERIHGDPWYFEEVLVGIQALYFDLSNEHCKQRELPRVPIGAVNDDGFLSDESFFRRDINNGFYTFVYRPRRILNYRQNNSSYLQLKLNAPSHQNSDPKGYVAEAAGRVRYRLSRAYFYS
jgi:hypothetical protein